MPESIADIEARLRSAHLEVVRAAERLYLDVSNGSFDPTYGYVAGITSYLEEPLKEWRLASNSLRFGALLAKE